MSEGIYIKLLLTKRPSDLEGTLFRKKTSKNKNHSFWLFHSIIFRIYSLKPILSASSCLMQRDSETYTKHFWCSFVRTNSTGSLKEARIWKRRQFNPFSISCPVAEFLSMQHSHARLISTMLVLENLFSFEKLSIETLLNEVKPFNLRKIQSE